jgi:hypothetical protein
MESMKKNTAFAIMLVVVALSAMIGFLFGTLLVPPPGRAPPLPPREEMMFLTSLKTMTSFVNMVISLPLLITYVKLYRELHSRFTLGLIVVILVLFFHAITSNPLLHNFFGYYALGLGPFTILPDAFATVALLVLFYLSLE